MPNPDGSLTQEEKDELLNGIDKNSMLSILDNDFNNRLTSSVFAAWHILRHKAGNGIITINNDISLKLHYTNILQNIFNLITFDKDERFELELEKTVNLPDGDIIIDVLVTGYKGDKKYTIAVKLKYYSNAKDIIGKPKETDYLLYISVYRKLDFLKICYKKGLCNEYAYFIMTDIDDLATRLIATKDRNDCFEWSEKGDYLFLEKPFFGGVEEAEE